MRILKTFSILLVILTLSPLGLPVILAQFERVPVMDMRYRIGELQCDGENGYFTLIFEVRTTDGSEYTVAQIQNALIFNEDLDAAITNIDTVSTGFNTIRDYDITPQRNGHFQPYFSEDRVLEYIITAKISATSFSVMGGPGPNDWFEVITFRIDFTVTNGALAAIDWFTGTPDFNVVGDNTGIPGVEFWEIWNLELTPPTSFPLSCETDIQVEKSVDQTNKNLGDTGTFTITVTNNGPDYDANDVVVDDILPAGLWYTNHTASSGVWDRFSGTWNVGDIPVGESETLVIEFVAGVPGAWTNTASLQSLVQEDPNPGNDSDQVTVIVRASDIRIQKVVDNNVLYQGDILTYIISVTNAGPDAATGVVVEDILPAGVDYIDGIPSKGSYNSGAHIWNIGSLAVGEIVTLTMRAEAVQTGLWSNHTTITDASPPDPNTANNTALTTILIRNEPVDLPDLEVTKTVNDNSVNVGDQVVFTITVTNNGPVDATDVQVTDAMDYRFDFDNSNPGPGNSYAEETGIWDVGNLASGASEILQITATATAEGLLYNRSVLTQVRPGDRDLSNNFAVVWVNVGPGPNVDLSVEKLIVYVPPDPRIGNSVQFSVTVRNNSSTQNATNVVVEDIIPIGLIYSSHTPILQDYNYATGRWNVGTLAAGASRTITITANITGYGQIVNCSEIIEVDQPDPNTTNNQSCVTFNFPDPGTDLEIYKTSGQSYYEVGEQVIFTVTVENNGPRDATSVEVTDIFPTGVTYQNNSPSQGTYIHGSGTGLWNVGSIAVGSSATLILTGTAATVGVWSNHCTITNMDQPDPDLSNNTEHKTIFIYRIDDDYPDPYITKTVDRSNVLLGENVVFTLRVTNSGPGTVNSVQVTDLMDRGLTYLTSSPAGQYDPETKIWNLASPITQGNSATLTITARADVEGVLANYAKISRVLPGDSNLNNNEDAVFVNVGPQGLPPVDLAINKQFISVPTNPIIGDHVEFSITVTNNHSTETVNQIRILDRLPVGLDYVSHTPSLYDYNHATGVWEAGSLAPGASAVLTIEAIINRSGTITNCSYITYADHQDPNTSNNADCASISIEGDVNLEIYKGVDDTYLYVGDPVVFTVTVINNGPGNATGVEVFDQLPPGIDPTGNTPSQGTYNPGTGTWVVGDIISGQSATLLINGEALLEGVWSNHSTITAMDQSDTNPSNNTDYATVDIQDPNNPYPDVRITKSANRSSMNVNEQVIFTISVINDGPGTASNIQVTDILHPGFSFISANPAANFDATTGIWQLANSLNQGGSATLTITARADSEGVLSNLSKITRVQPGDADLDNNEAVVFVNVGPGGTPNVDLSIVKQVTSIPPPAVVGDLVTYSITVTNNSATTTANNIRVWEIFPEGLNYVSHSPVGYDYNYATGIWRVGSLSPGQSRAISITASADRAGEITNCAHIENSDHQDPNSANNRDCATIVVENGADLEITKFSNDTYLQVGDPVTFTVRLTNNGPEDATGVQVTDLWPTGGITYTGNTPSQGSYNNGSGLWNVGNLNAGVTATLTINGTAAAEGLWSNHVTITAANEDDPDVSNNTDLITVRVENPPTVYPDVRIAKSANRISMNLDETVIFTVTVTNDGPGAVNSVQVTDILHEGFEYSTHSGGTFDPDTGIWTVGNLNQGQSAQLTITAIARQEGLLDNFSRISRVLPGDDDVSNNSVVVWVNVGQQSGVDLQIEKVFTTVPDPLVIGDHVQFTITVTNPSAQTVTNVRVRDVLPVDLNYVGHLPAGYDYDPATGIWNIGTINAGGSVMLTIEAAVERAGDITNCAHIEYSSNPDPNPANNEDCDTITVSSEETDLEVNKVANNTLLEIGEPVTFTVTITNNGPLDATGVTVSDILPQGVNLVFSLPMVGSYASGLWTIGNLADGASATLFLNCTASQNGIWTNHALINPFDQGDPEPSNDHATATIQVGSATGPDLSVSKTVNNSTPNVGENVIFTVSITNNGPGQASSVQLTDFLPDRVSYLSSTVTQGSYNSSNGIWNVGNMAQGVTATMTITVSADEEGTAINYAQITQTIPADPDLQNNWDWVEIYIGQGSQSDLAIDKSGVYSNGQITYTITIVNNGPNSANDIQVTEHLPVDVVYNTHTASQGSYNPGTGYWEVGALSSGSSATLSITVTPQRTGDITNCAVISGSSIRDTNPNNDIACTTVIVPEEGADLEIMKSVVPSFAEIGEPVIFTIRVINNGPEDATGVQVSDVWPAGVNYTGNTPSQGSYNNGSGLWNVGNLNAGVTATLTLNGTAAVAGVWTNHATITASNQDDPDPSNNTEYAIIIIDGGPGVNPDVRIVKTASDYNVNLNDLVTFTIQVFNDGPGTATDIQVTDLLHPGFEYQSSSPAGQYNSQTGVWTVGSITAGSSSTLTITVRALQEGVLANEAVLTRVRPGDSDPNNNNSTIFVNVGQRQGIDLQIVKEVTSLPDPAHIGDNVEFTVTVTNLSTTLTATDVRVIDMLPPGLDYVSHFPPAYDYTPATGEWNIGSIGPLQSMMIAITARIVMSGEIENCAYIDNSANPDPNTTNDEDCTSFTVIDEGADLEVNKVASITTPSVGDPVSFLVTVTNNGPEDATNIILHDILPAGVSYQSSTPSQGSFTQATGYWIWNVGSLANGATASLTIMTQAIQEGTWTNHALIISADQVDPDQTSNHAMAIIEIYDGPPDFPDLSVGKTVNNSNPSLGSQVIFTITVSNIGSGTASSVEITDILHPGLTFVSKWTSQGTYDETAGIWNVGTIAMGNVAQLRITATVDQEGTLSNYAVLTRALPGDDDPNNNQAWVFLYVDPSGPVADLSITKDAQISGTDIIYIIVVTNNGPSATDDVIIHDRLLPGILYVTHSASAGSYNPGTGLWHVGTLANGQSATLNITIHPEGFEDVENCAMVYNSSARDTNLSNDFACVTTSMGATVFLRIYLEGPFRFERTNNTHPDPSLMGTKLRHPAWNNGNSMIPIISPYPDARNAGVVNSNDLPADIVDWVYLQFRPAGDYEETEIVLGNDATGISCFLRDDGRIVDIDGSDGVRVAGLPEGQYYLIVDHRNHLKVMSATPVDTRELTDYNFGSTPKHYYDFTEAITQYLTPTGENLDRGCSQTPVDGKWMMSAGDGEKSHSVDQWDYNRWFELSDLNVGYWQLDHDLGGQIEGRDESFYYMNMGLRSPFSWLP